jgi:hypothetical protein
MLEPTKDASARPPQGRYVFGEQHEPERQHPEPEDGKNAQEPAADQQ